MVDVREAIDAIDAELVALIAKRFAYIDRAAELKLAAGLHARIPERVQQVVDQVRQHADVLNIDADLIEMIWRALIENAIAREERLMGPTPPLDPTESGTQNTL